MNRSGEGLGVRGLGRDHVPKGLIGFLPGPPELGLEIERWVVSTDIREKRISSASAFVEGSGESLSREDTEYGGEGGPEVQGCNRVTLLRLVSEGLLSKRER